MSKNFLLSKALILALTAIVLNSLVAPAWSMNEEDQEKKKSSAITGKMKSENENEDNNGNVNKDSTQESDKPNHFEELPLEIKVHILTIAAFDLGEGKRGLSNLALVCKDWNNNVVQNTNPEIKHYLKHAIKISWLRGLYKITDPQDIAIFERFYNGKLIYRPKEGSDEGMLTLPISDLRNPLGGMFDLSQCGNAGQYLSIAAGYRKVETSANANKVEIWLTPRFLVDKEMSQLAQNHHIRALIGNWDAARAPIRPLIGNWDAARAPIGIFWTWGGWNAAAQLTYCDYLVSESMDQLGSENLLIKYLKGQRTAGNVYLLAHVAVTSPKFQISFVN